MRAVWLVVGAVLVIVGVVWIFQGIGDLRGSFMTGSPFWAWMGVLAAATGAVALARAARPSRRRD